MKHNKAILILAAAMFSGGALAQNSTGSSAMPSTNTGSTIPESQVGSGQSVNPNSSTGITTSPSATTAPGMATNTQMNSADFDLSRRVRADLGNLSGAAAQNVVVTSKEGVLTLSGTVNSASDAAIVESRAKSMSGVSRIINNIQVNSAVR